MKENILIDTIEFEEHLDVDYKKIMWMFSSDHSETCCEWHELDFSSAESDFRMVEDILDYIDKIEIKWTIWMWITLFFYEGDKRVWVFVPWRGENTWYYSSDLDLNIIFPNWDRKRYDVSEYQDWGQDWDEDFD